jgi:hypothetical protein
MPSFARCVKMAPDIIPKPNKTQLDLSDGIRINTEAISSAIPLGMSQDQVTFNRLVTSRMRMVGKADTSNKSINTTQIYVKARDNRKQNAVKALSKIEFNNSVFEK